MSGETAAGRLEEAYRHCQALARDGEKDRYLATLLAPPAAQPALFALYAFAHEASRVRDAVKQALAGEIRLQWWRDVVMGVGQGDVSASPVALALLDAIERHDLPRQAFLDLLDARTFDLYDDPMPDIASLEGYCGETSSVLLRLASLIVADGGDPGGGDAPGHGGVALAVAGLLRGLPWSARMGQCFVPLELLQQHGATREDIVTGQDTPAVRAALADMRTLAGAHYQKFVAALSGAPAVVRAAFLPVAVTPLYLARLQGGWRPFQDVVEPAQWRRQWRLWRASRGAW